LRSISRGTDADLAKGKAAELAALKLVRNKVRRARWEVVLFDIDQIAVSERREFDTWKHAAGKSGALLLFHHFG
jgi:hypothetical protein